MALQETWDVIVVGGGGAGLAAAIEARSQGREVILLEKNPDLGGSTAWSIGSVTVTNSPHQHRKGIKDSPAAHYADMAKFAPDMAHLDNDELRWRLCHEFPDTFRWLLDKGVRFFGPMPEPPHRTPRMHNVLPNSRAFIHHLGRHARKIGVAIRCNARVVELLSNGDEVTGVAVEVDGAGRELRARGGVVLAAGDFTASKTLKAEFISEEAAEVEAVNVTATGDGQTMARSLGATIVNGNLALGPEIRFVPPARDTLARRLPPWTILAEIMAWSLDHVPNRLLRPFLMSFLTTALAPSQMLFEQGALLVNKRGERFADELQDPAVAIAQQPGKTAHILLDGALARKFSAWPYFISTAPGVAYAYLPDYRRSRRDIYRQADDLEGLAEALDMPRDSLAGAVAARNAEIDALQRAQESNAPLPAKLQQGPFIAVGPVRSVFVHNEGGLKVDGDLQVTGANGKPIDRLYAAGSTGQGGLLLKGHGHHLAWAFTSGRIAGRNAAYRAVSEDLPT